MMDPAVQDILMLHRYQRIRPDLNEWRFYELTIQADLFGGYQVIAENGRIGSPGTVRRQYCPSWSDALSAFRKLHLRRCSRGYDLVVNQPNAPIH